MLVACTACTKRFRTEPSAVARAGKCPHCAAEIRVPAAPHAEPAPAPSRKSPPATAGLTVEELGRSIEGPIQSVRTPITYRVALLLSTAVMLLIPVVYLLLIGATAFAVYYHATHHAGILTALTGRAAVLAAMVYAAPIVVGPILVFFMFKPFLSRPVREERRRSLSRANEPVLYEFVERVCDAVHAPRPQRIDVDCQLNASASFRRGFLSFLGSDLVLTIGMPLVAGLSLREFGGVLAHEFGHFSQGAGMRLTYVLRSISAWLARSVYERDSWDAWLESASESLDLRIGWVLLLARAVVWLTRQVLAGLLYLSMAIVGYTLRQMEFDADRHEARFAGSDAFESTCRKLNRLGVAYQQMLSQLPSMAQTDNLVDDIPALVLFIERRIDPGAQRTLDKRLAEQKGGWFDSHPNDRDRIRNAHAEKAPGVLRSDRPAADLFRDFRAQCQAATWELYRVGAGAKLDRSKLRTVEALSTDQSAADADFDAFNRYTQGLWRDARRWHWDGGRVAPATNPREAAELLKACRSDFEAQLATHRELVRQFDAARDALGLAQRVGELHQAGVGPKKGLVEERLATREGCSRARDRAAADVGRIGNLLEGPEKLLTRRLESALKLLLTESVAEQLPDGAAMRQKALRLAPALIAMDGQLTTLVALGEELDRATALLTVLQQKGATEPLVNRLATIARQSSPRLTQLRDVLRKVEWPYPDNDDRRTLGDRLAPEVPPADRLGDYLGVLELTVGNFIATRRRLSIELCGLAAQMEKALKLPPLPPPPETSA